MSMKPWILDLVVLQLVMTPALALGGEPIDPWRTLQQVERQIPGPGDHAGNVFLEGEVVTLPIGIVKGAARWRVTDDRQREVAHGTIEDGHDTIQVGKLGIGWYRLAWLDAEGQPAGWTTAAVLARLASPVPQDSPICVDSATAWFGRDDSEKQQHFAQLAALAGVNWVRDRMRWNDIEPAHGKFAQNTTYDSAATIQARHGLKVLQVHHDTPPWAVSGGGGTGRFPGDLRAAYRFGKAMSARFQGKVLAWEPWNEANIPNFGGHTMDEICSLQKAAYLGIKAGNPQVTVCWNVTTGVPTRLQTDGVLENETWPYYDTYNVHTYDWPEAYLRLWGPVREAACGKPIWVTESDRGIPFESDSTTRDLTPENEILKAQFIAQSYASSLQAGANRHFHFILGQYSEKNIQFGLLRHDLTPRPSYVALAAAGRLLAGARCLGRYPIDGKPDIHVIAFRAQPDGKPGDVLVAWTERQVDWPERGKCESDWPMSESVAVEACFDYLGRRLAGGGPNKLTSAPLYVVLPSGACEELTLQSPVRSALRPGSPSSVVLQCLMPKETRRQNKSVRWAGQFDHTVKPGLETELPLFVYNFSAHEVSGTISVEKIPSSCQVQPERWDVRLAPMARQRLPARFQVTGDTHKDSAEPWIKLRGEFSGAGRPVLAFRLTTTSSP
ncbi:MAG: hypothetical protein ACC645_22390 [Pirellulales bacterium]